MRAFFAITAALLLAGTQAFQTLTPTNSVRVQSALFAYVPSGFTAESYKKFKQEEAKKAAAAKNLGGMGPRGFQSRSLQSFQEAMERGEANHLMPMFNAKEKLKKGTIKTQDIPYMQRGGSWDNSDVKGAKQRNWLKSDKKYAGGGFKKEQSVSILGSGAGLDWTGRDPRSGPSETIQGVAPKFGKNYKAPNVNTMNRNGETKKKKNFFGF